MPTTHELKIWPEYYEAVVSGIKTFEIRRNDRGFKVGDTLHLREWNPETRHYTGRTVSVKVTYILKDWHEWRVVMSIVRADDGGENHDETIAKLDEAYTLLSDILPLAMGESRFYSRHPEADQFARCRDCWSPIVDRICETLGREKPKTGLGAWYKQLPHPNAVNELKRRNMERCVVIGAVSRAYQDGLTDWEQITAIVKEAMAKLHQHKHWLELGGQS